MLLGAADDADGGAVFDAAAGIEIFELGENVGGARRHQALKLKHGSLADQLSDIVGDAQAGHFGGFHGHTSGYEAELCGVNCQGDRDECGLRRISTKPF